MIQNIMNHLATPAEISNGWMYLMFYYFLYFFIKDIKRSDIGQAFIEELKNDKNLK
jgi:hypothetical protein